MKTRLYLDTRTSAGNPPYPLKLGISRQGKTAYIPMDIRLYPHQWDAERRCIADIPPRLWMQRDSIKNYIDRKRIEIESALFQLESEGKFYRKSALQIRDIVVQHLQYTDANPTTFIAFALRHIEGYDNTRTREIYLATIKRIEQLMPSASTLTMEDITPQWLTLFDKRLRPLAPSVNARSIHLRNIRTIINSAIDNDITNNYPFRKFKIRQEETIKRSLTLAQLITYLDAEVTPVQGQYRDIFLLMVYLLGINISDLCHLKNSDMVDGRIYYKRHKTHKLYSVKVEDEAMEIINRYRGKHYLLSICEKYRNYKDYLYHLNRNLKTILPEYPYSSISTYWSRHTIASLMANELDIPVETISASLGHTYGSKITAIYIDYNQQKVDVANRRLIDLITNGREKM